MSTYIALPLWFITMLCLFSAAFLVTMYLKYLYWEPVEKNNCTRDNCKGIYDISCKNKHCTSCCLAMHSRINFITGEEVFFCGRESVRRFPVKNIDNGQSKAQFIINKLTTGEYKITPDSQGAKIFRFPIKNNFPEPPDKAS